MMPAPGSSPLARKLWHDGYLDGYRNGLSDGYRAAGEQADLAARRFLALEAAEAHSRADMQRTRDMMSTPRYIARPALEDSAGITRKQPTLDDFMAGIRAGGILRQRLEVAA